MFTMFRIPSMLTQFFVFCLFTSGTCFESGLFNSRCQGPPLEKFILSKLVVLQSLLIDHRKRKSQLDSADQLVDVMVRPSLCNSFNGKTYRQWLAGFAVTMLLTQVGAMCGWTSPYLARLTAEGSPLPLTAGEASWVASLLNVGRFLGAIIGALCAHFWGSKRAILLTMLPISLSWSLILVADRALMLYIARVSGGLALGMAFSCFPLYIGEIALPKIRGSMVTLGFCGSPFGSVVASLAGYYLTYSQSSLIFLLPSLLNVGLFAWLPDSPHYLVRVGRTEAARKSIEWYRSGEQVEEELEAVQKFVLSSSEKSVRQKFADFHSLPVRRALIITIMLFVFMQICGLNSVIFYMEIIFRRGKTDLIKPSLAVILVNLMGFLTAIFSVKLMDRCGRRILLVVSGLGITLSMGALGTHFLLIDMGYDATKFQWLPVVSVFLYMMAFVLGLLPVPSAVLSEMFPANVKCIAACMASLGAGAFAFAATKTYQPMVDAFGEACVFYIHAGLTVLVIPFVLFYMPETKGKSLQEIQEILMRN